MKRDLAALHAEHFDLLVLGGGILGASVAWEAVRRGLRVALLEKDDFASGASANTMRIIHGGLRYLQQLDVGRMRRSIRERSAWLRIAPHLVEPAAFCVPSYRSGIQRKSLMGLAVILNELVSCARNRELPPDRRIPAGRVVTRSAVAKWVPELVGGDLTGGIVFYDGLVYSAERLVVEVLRAAVEEGVVAANHVALEAPLRIRGRLSGVVARDRLGDDTFEVRASAIVNATGACVGPVARALLGGGPDERPRRHVLALNLVIPSTGHRMAFAVPTAVGGAGGLGAGKRRQLFVVPWRGRTLVGTAYYGRETDGEGPGHLEPYVARFLAEVDAALPDLGLRRSDVVRVHHGLLPLREDAGPTHSGLLREHRIRIGGREEGSPVVSVEIEKYTTARFVAEETVRRVLRLLGHDDVQASPPPVLPAGFGEACADLVGRARREHPGLEPDVAEHLVRSYGRRYVEVVQYSASWPGWNRRVVPDASIIEAQLRHAVDREMARTASDILDRRTEIGPRGLVTERAAALAERIAKASGEAYRGTTEAAMTSDGDVAIPD